MKNGLMILRVVFTTVAPAQHRQDSVGSIKLTRQTIVHYQVMIKGSDTRYLFSTSRGISSFSYKYMQNWKKEKPALASGPQGTVNAIPSFKGYTWAPDISYHNLYCSVSTLEKNTSCTVPANNKASNLASPEFKWEDEEKVYDAKDKGTPKLIIDQLEWGSQGWAKAVNKLKSNN
jgi:hypothetical protein